MEVNEKKNMEENTFCSTVSESSESADVFIESGTPRLS